MKNVLEKNVLKFHESLHKYLLTCQVNSANLDSFFLHWSAATLKGLVEFLNVFFSTPLFAIIFFPKWLFQELRF